MYKCPGKGCTIFPNPASGVLNIRSRRAVIQSVGITDLLGRQAYEQSDINAQFVAVDVSAFPEGVYFLKVNGVSAGKFAKE